MQDQADDRELLRRYHEQGDPTAREQLVQRHLPLVRSLARRYAGRGEALEDIEQVGAIGLLKAIDRYELDREVALTTYATPNVVGEIKRHFRDRGSAIRIPRNLKELNARTGKAIEHLTASLGRSPTIAEIANDVGATAEQVLEGLEAGSARSTLSLSSVADDDGDLDPMEAVGEEDPQYERVEDRAALEPALGALPTREREILRMRFEEGLTQTQIAERVGVSQMHVSRLIRKSLEQVRAELA
ncbi:MAG TPA: SigB/SigF/SigG family RNA polymerase sigma factor [Thermoleophilaceae bacterium]